MARIAVIGTGGWGKNHARVLSDLNSLVAVCDMDQARAQDIAAKYRINWYTSVDDLLGKEKLDGAIISTPTSTHFQVARQVMDRKIGVLVEKPMALTSTEAKEMLATARRNNVLLTAGYIERFNPAVNDVKNMISSKKYGDALMLEFHRENRRPRSASDAGIIFDTSVHDIDTALHLFADTPKVVFARAGSKGGQHEDIAAIMLGFSNERTAFIASNWITPKRVRCFTAVCTEAIITGDFITQEVRIDQGENTTIPRREYKEPLILELTNFIDSIAGKAKPLVGAEDALNTTSVAEAALLSSKTGSQIYLDLK